MFEPPPESLEIRGIGDVTVVGFRSSILSEVDIQLVQGVFCGLINKHSRKKILLNFENVEYLSSAALGEMIKLHKKVTTGGGRLSLCNVAPPICEVFELTRLNKVLAIEPDPGGKGPDDDASGVTAKLKPPKPSGGAAVSLKPPAPESDG
jgi:anti-sigma B factor antagonist